MGLYLVREQFQSDMYLARKSKSISNTFLFCLQKYDNLELQLVSNFKNSRDRENATFMLYHNICNIWHKYKVQMSYKVIKILGYIQNVYNCTNM